jgi:hypothetical protein
MLLQVHLAKSKAAAGFELVLYTKTGWVTVNRLITWLQEFPDPSRDLGIIMLLFQMQMKANCHVFNEIV